MPHLIGLQCQQVRGGGAIHQPARRVSQRRRVGDNSLSRHDANRLTHKREFQRCQQKGISSFHLPGLPSLQWTARSTLAGKFPSLHRGDAMLIMPFYARLAHVSTSLMPNLTAEILGFLMRFSVASRFHSRNEASRAGTVGRKRFAAHDVGRSRDQRQQRIARPRANSRARRSRFSQRNERL